MRGVALPSVIGDNTVDCTEPGSRAEGFDPTDITLVGAVPRRRPSNSTSRYDGLRGTWPTTYGRPFSVGACFHCLDLLDGEKREGSRRLLDVVSASCCLYSKGTNSSKSKRLVAVRGSEPPETVLRVVGIDLNST